MFKSVGKCLSVITTVKTNYTYGHARENPLDTRYSHIIVEFERNTLTLEALGDCCSDSWFEVMPTDDVSVLQTLVGKTVTDLKTETRKLNLPDSNVQECDRNHINEFIYDNSQGITLQFLLRNASNGYYDGYIHSKWKYHTHCDTPIPSSARLTVVVGMPGCGKTTYVKTNYKPLIVHEDDEDNDEDTDEYTYHFFDDYLDSPTVIHKHIMPLLLQGKRVIIADPRLCDRKVFDKEILQTFVSDDSYKVSNPNLMKLIQLKIVRFEDDAYHSIRNIMNREKDHHDAVDYIQTIIKIRNNHKNILTIYNLYGNEHVWKWKWTWTNVPCYATIL